MYDDDYEDAIEALEKLSDESEEVLDLATEFMDHARDTLLCIKSHYDNHGLLPESPVTRFVSFVLLLVVLLGGLVAWGATAKKDDFGRGYGRPKVARPRTRFQAAWQRRSGGLYDSPVSTPVRWTTPKGNV